MLAMKSTRKSKTRILCITLITALAISVTVDAAIPVNAVYGETPGAPSSFSIIWIGDTQYLSESYPSYYDNLCNWIVNNNATYNIKMVIHTGDIVNVPDDTAQWTNANQSMSILLNSGIPYCWDAGNHDYDTDLWIGNQFTAFNPSVMQTKPYWVSDAFDGLNTAVRFNVDGWDCLIINSAFHANDTVLAWANSLLDAYPTAHAIVATHGYIDQRCSRDTWALNLKNTVLDTHPNVFLTLSGHYHPTTGARTLSGNRNELLFNEQDAASKMGADSARILTFDLAKNTIAVQTYEIYKGQFLTDGNNNFTLTTNFQTCQTCDSTGTSKSSFDPGDDVYFAATGLSTSTTYPLYVVQDVSAWTIDTTIPTRISDTATSVTTDSSGNIAPTDIYSNAKAGKYDVVVDVNSNGKYDSGDLLVDNVVTSAGLFVLPEYTFGALIALGACFVAFIAYAAVKNGTGMLRINATQKTH